MGFLKWHREGKAVNFLKLLSLLCDQGKQLQLRKSSITNPRGVIHGVLMQFYVS